MPELFAAGTDRLVAVPPVRAAGGLSAGAERLRPLRCGQLRSGSAVGGTTTASGPRPGARTVESPAMAYRGDRRAAAEARPGTGSRAGIRAGRGRHRTPRSVHRSQPGRAPHGVRLTHL